MLRPAVDGAVGAVDAGLAAVDGLLGGIPPWQLVLWTVALTALLSRLCAGLVAGRRAVQDKGWKHILASWAFGLPGVRGQVAAREAREVDKLTRSMAARADPDALRELPAKGMPAQQLLDKLAAKVRGDAREALFAAEGWGFGLDMDGGGRAGGVGRMGRGLQRLGAGQQRGPARILGQHKAAASSECTRGRLGFHRLDAAPHNPIPV